VYLTWPTNSDKIPLSEFLNAVKLENTDSNDGLADHGSLNLSSLYGLHGYSLVANSKTLRPNLP
jgi:hypothetical protein